MGNRAKRYYMSDILGMVSKANRGEYQVYFARRSSMSGMLHLRDTTRYSGSAKERVNVRCPDTIR
jgi:hypothetical protein